jgi:hypothetical protein
MGRTHWSSPTLDHRPLLDSVHHPFAAKRDGRILAGGVRTRYLTVMRAGTWVGRGRFRSAVYWTMVIPSSAGRMGRFLVWVIKTQNEWH